MLAHTEDGGQWGRQQKPLFSGKNKNCGAALDYGPLVGGRVFAVGVGATASVCADSHVLVDFYFGVVAHGAHPTWTSDDTADLNGSLV